MQTQILGYPRIGANRELKKACENYWAGKIELQALLQTSRTITKQNWALQQATGIDLIPCNDFSFYDQVLDFTLSVGAIPARFNTVALNKKNTELDLYFAMARGYQKDNLDITAMEMTKWFDTNYHYIVPEFVKNQEFKYFSNSIVNEFIAAKKEGFNPKTVLIGPITYLLLGKEKEEGFDRIDLIENLLPVYFEIIQDLINHGANTIQFDEPFLALDLDEKSKTAYREVYKKIRKEFPQLTIQVATYFDGLKDNTALAINLPIDILHLDLVRDENQIDEILNLIPSQLKLSLGLVDGRNIWKNDFQKSLSTIEKVVNKIGEKRVIISTSCSLLHSPCDLDLETNEKNLPTTIKDWFAFAKQKLEEVAFLKNYFSNPNDEKLIQQYEANQFSINNRKNSQLIHQTQVKERVNAIKDEDYNRANSFEQRKIVQQNVLNLPPFPTTTIGSFPQTQEVRSWRAKYKKGELSAEEYDVLLKQETKRTIEWQEEIGIDVLVHGEYERNDMVEYFGEKIAGFVFSKNGWVQSYGTRCVKPPIIFGDVYRPVPMTVYWSKYAQSITEQKVKGMLTGPVTILQWSFVRDDQPRSTTCKQIALAIRDEVSDLEKAGIKIIQIDEPAIREGLPLRKDEWQNYLKWAVDSFKLASSNVDDSTQIHTHMCYSEFNDIIQNIADLDADVITIECSRSQMELLNAFSDFNYPNDIGPGVYDIHSPRVPSKEEMVDLIEKAAKVIPADQLWVNPDCGLKTRHWEETEKALIEMVAATKELRKIYTPKAI
ncbi:5-methyltetrahydropteroyltriglutamate--homocysteine S-methyltransferase [Empedobacter falsenii]|uniref:5-methyltetrahydropteroyltriglutamate-- homocysteine S-methyltransferase n=1 Tax=Empedobacter falsenii TaxID=343874 RepID=UPI001C8DB7D2|nr:5-methyltetrahydropteroyltriglutamate--homocysteine S-methyltransferase [Empedobacter falsenii]MBY0067781.1 5-methyltetrahydropteroyltriglutamate--homocysteine S-methyltransferase [Empedobacter falsenii]